MDEEQKQAEQEHQAEYHENEERDDFPDFELVYRRWKLRETIKAESQLKMYQRIANTWGVGKAVLDAGCGMGIGTNILGHSALGVWGIDNNPANIKIAKQFFESPTIKFEEIDLLKPLPRPVASFDVVACIEVIEHVKDYDTLLNTLKQFYDPKRRTVFFISSPNRNSHRLGHERPNNEFHVREWTAGEFYEVMTKHFKSVVIYSVHLLDTFDQSETVDGTSLHTPLLAKCEDPITV